MEMEQPRSNISDMFSHGLLPLERSVCFVRRNTTLSIWRLVTPMFVQDLFASLYHYKTSLHTLVEAFGICTYRS